MPKYAFSFDEERYDGQHETPEEAAKSAFDERPEAVSCFVGEVVPPTPPTHFIDADTLIEAIKNQDEYSEEWSESWPRATTEQKQELTEELRFLFRKWMARHGLEPAFFTVENARTMRNENPIPETED